MITNPAITIEQLDPNDLASVEGVRTVCKESFDNYTDEEFAKTIADGTFYYLCYGSLVVSALSLTPISLTTSYSLDWVSTLKSQRGKGFSSMLVRYAIINAKDELNEKEKCSFSLMCEYPLQGFYEKLGFYVTHRLRLDDLVNMYLDPYENEIFVWGEISEKKFLKADTPAYDNSFSWADKQFYADLRAKGFPISYWNKGSEYIALAQVYEDMHNPVTDYVSYPFAWLGCLDAKDTFITHPKSVSCHDYDLHISTASFKDNEVYTETAFILALEGTFEDYEASLRKEDRASLRKAYSVNQDEDLSLRIVTKQVDKDALFEKFLDQTIQWSIEKWQTEDYSDYLEPCYRTWYLNQATFIRTLALSEHARILILYKGNEFLGINVAEFRATDKMYIDIWSSRNPTYDKPRQLGKFLVYEAIRDAFRMKAAWYNCGVFGDHEYKYSYMPKNVRQNESYYDLCSFLKLMKGSKYTGHLPPYFEEETLIAQPIADIVTTNEITDI